MWRSLRLRIVALVLVAVLPACIVLVWTARTERALLEETARAALLEAARDAGRIHAQTVGEIHGVLAALSAAPSVRGGDGAACAEVAARLLAEGDVYGNVAVARPDGEIFCSAVRPTGGVSVAGLGFFRRALAEEGVVLGELGPDPVIDRPTLTVASAVRSDIGAVMAVAFLSIDVQKVGRSEITEAVPEGFRVTVVDRGGTILAQRPLGAELLPVGGDVLTRLDEVGAGSPGLVFSEGERLAAIALLGREPGAWVVVEVPRAALFARSEQAFLTAILVVVALAFLTILGATWAGEVFVLRRVSALSDLATRLAGGDLGARVGPGRGDDEIGRLEGALDQMAVAIDQLTRRNRLILESAGEGIISVGLAGKVESANPAACTLLGRSEGEVIGRSLHGLVHADTHSEAECPLGVRLAAADATLLEDHFQRPEGAPVPVRIVASPIQDGGARTGVVLFLADERRRILLEQQLRQAQKMEVVGRLSGGVAHDFNNLLTALLGYGELLRDRMGPARSPRELDEMIKSAHRAAALTRQLLAFSRQEVASPRVVDPNVLVRGTERLLRRLIGEEIELVLELDPKVRNVRVDVGQIEQVLLNLAVNARDAMVRRGRLTVRTRALPDGRVGLEVQDTGAGMSPAVQARIFEPFFTTKATGTGLGLAIVADVVQLAGGEISVQSAVGAGTTFALALPGTSAPAEPAWEPDLPVVAGTETILLVEDEPTVRAFARRALEGKGYLVLEAVDAEEAEACADAHVGPIHLVLTDIVLPGPDGVHLAERLQSARPELRALFMTGYAAPPRAEGFSRLEVLPKPFGANVLMRRVRRVLDGGAEAVPDNVVELQRA
jgi:PAS domain S-box-containing protein